jgi:hypothetical protein
MPGLFLPRFRPTDAIDARMIDKCVQSIADVLNGGLTRENIAPYFKLTKGDFTENRSIYSLRAVISADVIDASNNAIPVFGATPYASSLIGMGYCLKADSFPATGRQLDLMVGDTLIYRHPLPLRDAPANISGTNYLIGFVQPRASAIIAANSVLRLSWPTLAGSTPIGSVTLFLSTDWVT